jgi:hypothetical protein
MIFSVESVPSEKIIEIIRFVLSWRTYRDPSPAEHLGRGPVGMKGIPSLPKGASPTLCG